MKHEPLPGRAAWVLIALFVFTVPFEKTVQLDGFGTASRLLGLLAFLLGAAAVVRGRRIRRPNLVLTLAAVFAVWMASTRFWSIAPDATDSKALTFAQLLAMAWLVWEFARSGRRYTVLLGAYVAGAAVASAGTVIRYMQRQQTYYRRYAAAGFDPNDLGLTVALSIPLAFYVSLRTRGAVRYACWAAIALAESAVLLSGSRTALIANFAAFAFAALRWRESDAAQRVASVALLALLVIGLVGLAPAASRARFSTLHTEVTQGSLHGRTRIWKTGLKALTQRPVIGVGAGAYPTAVRPWLGVPAIPGHEYVAHNTFLSVLVEGGMIGFALFALTLIAAAVFTWMLPGRDAALWSVMLAVWFAGVSTLTWEHRKPTWLILALITTAWARAFREEP